MHFQDTPGPIARTVSDMARALAAPGAGGFTQAVDIDVSLASWRIGVLETGFGPDGNPDAEPVNRVIRAAIARLAELGVSMISGLEIAELSEWITDTSVYLRQSKADINDFLSKRPHAPVSSFMEIYDSKQFHPLNDLFDGIATGPDTTEGDIEYLRRRLNQQHFQRLILNIFGAHGLDFLVYPTVQVIPPTREELAAEKYRSLTFPTNTVIGSQAGLPALTIPVGFTGGGLPIGLELLGTPLAERKMLQFARAWEKATQPRIAPAL